VLPKVARVVGPRALLEAWVVNERVHAVDRRGEAQSGQTMRKGLEVMHGLVYRTAAGSAIRNCSAGLLSGDAGRHERWEA